MAATGVAPGAVVDAVILGLGTDLVGVDRVRAVLARHGERFLERIYSAEERSYCLAAADPGERLAARWAAKEAAMKALGTGWSGGVHFRHVAVLRADSGAPTLELSAGALAIAREKGVTATHLSLSHADGFAMATVILEG